MIAKSDDTVMCAHWPHTAPALKNWNSDGGKTDTVVRSDTLQSGQDIAQKVR